MNERLLRSFNETQNSRRKEFQFKIKINEVSSRTQF